MFWWVAGWCGIALVFSRETRVLLGYDFFRAENQDRCELRFRAFKIYLAKVSQGFFRSRHGDKSPASIKLRR